GVWFTAGVLGREPSLRARSGSRRTKNRIATVRRVVAFVLVVIRLVFVLITVVARGIKIISWQFLTADIPPQVVPAGIGGIGPAIVGTIEIVALATVMAVPLGVLGAIYLNEDGGQGVLGRLIGVMAAVMAGVPSLVMGLFTFSISAPHLPYPDFSP